MPQGKNGVANLLHTSPTFQAALSKTLGGEMPKITVNVTRKLNPRSSRRPGRRLCDAICRYGNPADKSCPLRPSTGKSEKKKVDARRADGTSVISPDPLLVSDRPPPGGTCRACHSVSASHTKLFCLFNLNLHPCWESGPSALFFNAVWRVTRHTSASDLHGGSKLASVGRSMSL